MKLAHALLLAILILTGCASTRQDRFVVQASALDYLQIVRTVQPAGGGLPVTTRVDLSGSGYLQVMTGRSERIRTGFWQDTNAPAWQDLRRDYIVLPPHETLAFFQAFVNAGVFDRRRESRTDPPPELAILISVRGRKTLLLTAEPQFLYLYDALLRRF